MVFDFLRRDKSPKVMDPTTDLFWPDEKQYIDGATEQNELTRRLVYRVSLKDIPSYDKVKNFSVMPFQWGVFYVNGKMVEQILDGGYYEIPKEALTAGTEIVWLTGQRIKQKWGVPKNTKTLSSQDNYILGINGEIEYKIKDPATFINEVVGPNKNFSNEQLREDIKNALIRAVKETFSQRKLFEIIATTGAEDRADMRDTLNYTLSRFGLELIDVFFNRPVIDEVAKEDLEDDLDDLQSKVRKLKKQIEALEEEVEELEADQTGKYSEAYIEGRNAELSEKKKKYKSLRSDRRTLRAFLD